MPITIDVKAKYSDLSNALVLFSKITQIKTYVYLSENVLLKDGTFYTNSNEIQKKLNFKSNETISLFPIIANANVFGCVICNATSVSQERINLTRTYLENIFNSTASELIKSHIQILNPLTAESIARLRTLLFLFKPALSGSAEKPKQTKNESEVQTENLSECSANVKHALDYINHNIKKSLSLESVSQSVFLSSSYLSKIFKKKLHINFVNHVNTLKVALACEKLITTDEKVSTIAKQVGWGQTSYFSKVFKNITGMTPLAYRRNNHSVEKVYTISHDISWKDDDTVFDVSRRFFKKHNIPYSIQMVNGYPYINLIGDFADSVKDRGWIYTVNCRQPIVPASALLANKNSVIQWIYTAYD